MASFVGLRVATSGPRWVIGRVSAFRLFLFISSPKEMNKSQSDDGQYSYLVYVEFAS